LEAGFLKHVWGFGDCAAGYIDDDHLISPPLQHDEREHREHDQARTAGRRSPYIRDMRCVEPCLWNTHMDFDYPHMGEHVRSSWRWSPCSVGTFDKKAWCKSIFNMTIK